MLNNTEINTHTKKIFNNLTETNRKKSDSKNSYKKKKKLNFEFS